MTDKNEELDRLLRDHRMLTPQQRDLLTRRVIERARAYRTEAIRKLFRQLLGWISQRAAAARLHSFDDRMLKDIGIHRSEIEAAVRAPDKEALPAQSSVMAFDQARPAKPRGTIEPPHDHVGRAA